jgi:hypothetical protein
MVRGDILVGTACRCRFVGHRWHWNGQDPHDRLALRIGTGLILVGLLLVVLGGGPSAIFNVHDWEIVLVLPLPVIFLDGTMLIYTGLFR